MTTKGLLSDGSVVYKEFRQEGSEFSVQIDIYRAKDADDTGDLIGIIALYLAMF